MGLSCWLIYEKDVIWNVWRGSECASGINNNFFYIYWHVPLESVCKYLLVEACVMWKPVNWFAKQIGWLVFMWFRFLMGVFPNIIYTILFSEAAIQTSPSIISSPIIIAVTGSFLVGLQTVYLWIYLRIIIY